MRTKKSREFGNNPESQGKVWKLCSEAGKLLVLVVRKTRKITGNLMATEEFQGNLLQIRKFEARQAFSTTCQMTAHMDLSGILKTTLSVGEKSGNYAPSYSGCPLSVKHGKTKKFDVTRRKT